MSNDRDVKYNRPQPNDLPTIKELRASQENGSVYPGTSDKTLNEKMEMFNQGTGILVEDISPTDWNGTTRGRLPWEK